MHEDDIRFHAAHHARHIIESTVELCALNHTKNEAEALTEYLQTRGFAYEDSLARAIRIIANVVYVLDIHPRDLPGLDLDAFAARLSAVSASYRI